MLHMSTSKMTPAANASFAESTDENAIAPQSASQSKREPDKKDGTNSAVMDKQKRAKSPFMKKLHMSTNKMTANDGKSNGTASSSGDEANNEKGSKTAKKSRQTAWSKFAWSSSPKNRENKPAAGEVPSPKSVRAFFPESDTEDETSRPAPAADRGAPANGRSGRRRIRMTRKGRSFGRVASPAARPEKEAACEAEGVERADNSSEGPAPREFRTDGAKTKDQKPESPGPAAEVAEAGRGEANSWSAAVVEGSLDKPQVVIPSEPNEPSQAADPKQRPSEELTEGPTNAKTEPEPSAETTAPPTQPEADHSKEDKAQPEPEGAPEDDKQRCPSPFPRKRTDSLDYNIELHANFDDANDSPSHRITSTKPRPAAAPSSQDSLDAAMAMNAASQGSFPTINLIDTIKSAKSAASAKLSKASMSIKSKSSVVEDKLSKSSHEGNKSKPSQAASHQAVIGSVTPQSSAPKEAAVGVEAAAASEREMAMDRKAVAKACLEIAMEQLKQKQAQANAKHNAVEQLATEKNELKNDLRDDLKWLMNEKKKQKRRLSSAERDNKVKEGELSMLKKQAHITEVILKQDEAEEEAAHAEAQVTVAREEVRRILQELKEAKKTEARRRTTKSAASDKKEEKRAATPTNDDAPHSSPLQGLDLDVREDQTLVSEITWQVGGGYARGRAAKRDDGEDDAKTRFCGVDNARVDEMFKGFLNLFVGDEDGEARCKCGNKNEGRCFAQAIQ
mmetsp:Transcript_30300/g.64309  ORF Transcript_30300/g.64309 Transcript_30300/m.64309 type:complete len:734 (+) Transcript_30300:314-2515(+)